MENIFLKFNSPDILLLLLLLLLSLLLFSRLQQQSYFGRKIYASLLFDHFGRRA